MAPAMASQRKDATRNTSSSAPTSSRSTIACLPSSIGGGATETGAAEYSGWGGMLLKVLKGCRFAPNRLRISCAPDFLAPENGASARVRPQRRLVGLKRAIYTDQGFFGRRLKG